MNTFIINIHHFKFLNIVHLECHEQVILWHLPSSSILGVSKIYKRFDQISLWTYDLNSFFPFIYMQISHQWDKVWFYISTTEISPDLNLAAVSRKSLTWSTFPFSKHTTKLWGSGTTIKYAFHLACFDQHCDRIGWLPVPQTWNDNLPSLAARIWDES